MDHTRDPCPWVALNDFGGAFCMGVRNCTILSTLQRNASISAKFSSVKVIRKKY